MIIQTYLYTAQEPHWTPLIHTATTKELLNEGLLIEKIKDEEIGKMIADIGFTINNSFISMTDIDIWEANDIKSKWSHIVQLCNWKIPYLIFFRELPDFLHFLTNMVKILK